MILAGDIGGTKTVLGLFEPVDGRLEQLRTATYASREHPTFEGVLGTFLADGGGMSFEAGCFGVAGAVIDGCVHTTNLPWTLEEKTLAALIRAPRVTLLNDLQAAAYGVLFLPPAELQVLNAGSDAPHRGNVAVIAAGTGLGEAMLFWDGTQFHPIASEGGHTDFGPRNDDEIALLRYLRDKFAGHVSYERILSGPGVFNVYSFLRDCGWAPESPHLRERLQTGDASATVSELGVAGKDPLCVRTLEMFAEIYGAEAANLAVKCLALGGVYVTGGIAPKILPVLMNGSFQRGFTDKGRFRPLLESLPVKVALNPQTPLIGAAYYALRKQGRV